MPTTTAEAGIVIDGGASLAAAEAAPVLWATILVAILGVVVWGVYRYAADTRLRDDY